MIAVLLTCVTLVFSAWAFGAVEEWAVLTVQCLTLLAAVLALPEIRRQTPMHRSVWREVWDWRWGLPLILLSAFLLLQALNPSHTYSSSDYGLSPRDHIPFLPSSVAGDVTLGALLRFLTYATVAWTVTHACRTRERRHFLLGVVTLGGFAMSVLAILREMETKWNPELTGMFVNENNYAEYANMLIPVALSLGRAAHLQASARMQRSHPTYLYYFAAAMLATSVFTSGSRAGAIICVASVTAWLCMEIVLGLRFSYKATWVSAFSLLLPIFLGAALLLIFGAETYKTDTVDLNSIAHGLGGRIPILRATFRMFQDRWVYGIGGGTFYCAFPYYQPADTTHYFFRYAHNDWLQFLSELGIVGTTFALALIVGLIWRLVTGPRQRSSQIKETSRSGRRRSVETCEERGVIIAIAGLLVHACVDFPFYIPAIPLLASAYLGILHSLRHNAPRRHRPRN